MSLLKFKKILKSQIYFEIPQKKNFLIFDQVGSENIKKNLPFNTWNILCTRGEKINLFILIKMLIKFKFSNRSYIEEYIKTLKPKALITWIDNNIFFYQLKFKNIKKISIQNGRRSNLPADIFYNLEKKKIQNLKCDYVFTHNDSITNFYKNYIDSKFLVTGSFKSNNCNINENLKKYELLYVSTFRNLDNYNLYKNYDWCEWQKKEIILLKFADEYCQKFNKKLTILGSEMDSKSEIKFFKNCLKINFQFIKKKKNRNVYKLVDQSKVIFGIDSTLLSEALGRKAKVAFFSYRGNHYPFNSRKFGWPAKYSNKGFFWDNEVKYKNFERIINLLFKTKTIDWKNICKLHQKKIMKFNKNNKRFKDLITSIQKN